MPEYKKFIVDCSLSFPITFEMPITEEIPEGVHIEEYRKLTVQQYFGILDKLPDAEVELGVPYIGVDNVCKSTGAGGASYLSPYSHPEKYRELEQGIIKMLEANENIRKILREFSDN